MLPHWQGALHPGHRAAGPGCGHQRPGQLRSRELFILSPSCGQSRPPVEGLGRLQSQVACPKRRTIVCSGRNAQVLARSGMDIPEGNHPSKRKVFKLTFTRVAKTSPWASSLSSRACPRENGGRARGSACKPPPGHGHQCLQFLPILRTQLDPVSLHRHTLLTRPNHLRPMPRRIHLVSTHFKDVGLLNQSQGGIYIIRS